MIVGLNFLEYNAPLYYHTVEELPVDASYGSSFSPSDFVPPPRDPEKADMRIVESAAKDVSMDIREVCWSLKQPMKSFLLPRC